MGRGERDSWGSEVRGSPARFVGERGSWRSTHGAEVPRGGAPPDPSPQKWGSEVRLFVRIYGVERGSWRSEVRGGASFVGNILIRLSKNTNRLGWLTRENANAFTFLLVQRDASRRDLERLQHFIYLFAIDKIAFGKPAVYFWLVSHSSV